MSSSFAFRRRSVRLRTASVGAGMLCIIAFAAICAKAQDAPQDVAEAARQEKARKAAQAESASRNETHIYTNEDLKRPRILVEEESARVAAHRQNSVAPSPAPAETKSLAASDADKSSGGESLGAVARRYRREKSEREAKQASAIPPTSHFHLEVPAGSLAEVAPNAVSSLPASALPLPVSKYRADGFPLKRDPFSRPATGLARNHGDSTNAISEVPVVRLSAPPKNITPASTAATKSAPATPANGARVSSAPVITPGPASRAQVSSRVYSAGALPTATGPIATRATTGAIATRARGTVTIRAGDSLWNLSRRYFGSGARWREWLARNPGVDDPQRLRPGTRLLVPKSGTPPPLLKKTEGGNDGRTITVRNGDSLWKISAERYGDGARWPCVALANPELRDARMLHPGQIVTIPAACGNAGSSFGAIAP